MTYKIGVDGGASKTDCILVDESGAVAARRVALGCNPSVVGAEAAGRIVREALAALLHPASPAAASDPPFAVSHTLLCMAGSRAFWREFAAGLSGFGRVAAEDDALPILELATDGGEGLVLHAGTGSFVAARTSQGQTHYAGGLGWRLGDPGSGYDIGRNALSRALLGMQAGAPPSPLGRLVRQRLGADGPGEILGRLYADPSANALIAGLAPGVLSLAGEGEAEAREIVAASVGALAGLAREVARRLFPRAAPASLPAGLSGPILTHPAVLSLLGSGTEFSFRVISAPPVEGVRRLLCRTA